MNIKKEFLNSLPSSNLVITDTFEIGHGKVIYIKQSKIYEEYNNYWFTINTDNIKNFQVHRVTDIILIGSAGYYDIPINVLKEFVDNFAVVPPYGKYHMNIYLENHLLSQNSLNQIDVSDYYKELPQSIKDNLNKESDEKQDRNYFAFWTKKHSINNVSDNSNKVEYTKEGFWFTGNYNSYDLTNKGDIGFFVQKGDPNSKGVDWEIGLSAICEVVEKRKDLQGKKTSRGAKYFDVLLKPVFILPKVLNKKSFKKYPNTNEIVHVARTYKNDPNQSNWQIPLDLTKNLVGALIDIFTDDKLKIENIFGSHFANTPINIPPNITNNNLQNQFENLKFNLIENEPRNLIVYGAPGTGKSYKLKKEAEELFPHEWLRTRITFHPNYSYRNFVGSYKPMPLYRDSKKKIFSSDAITENRKHQKEPFIEYQFEPGPFLEMLVRAIQNQRFNFIIIIEEINRANTAGVFGDVFQLLDRNDSGESEYSITLEPSAHDYLKANGIITSSIIIPKNLYLWATMNSADQGVMPLDSAFKRRWSFEHIGLNENMNSVDNKYIEIPFIRKENKKLKWNEFRKAINEKLLSEGIHEDKLIGPFFLNKFEISNAKSVKNKLLLYLKEDVLRYKSCLFHGDLRSFSEISECFINGDNIFSDDMIFITEPLGKTDEDIEQRLDQTNSGGIEIEKQKLRI